MGRLLADVSRKMQFKAVESSRSSPSSHPPTESAGHEKLLVHSTHDTTLAGMCKTLDVFDDRCVGSPVLQPIATDPVRNIERWPAFTAHVTFELFSRPVSAPATAGFWQSVMPFWRGGNKEHCALLF